MKLNDIMYGTLAGSEGGRVPRVFRAVTGAEPKRELLYAWPRGLEDPDLPIMDEMIPSRDLALTYEISDVEDVLRKMEANELNDPPRAPGDEPDWGSQWDPTEPEPPAYAEPPAQPEIPGDLAQAIVMQDLMNKIRRTGVPFFGVTPLMAALGMRERNGQ